MSRRGFTRTDLVALIVVAVTTVFMATGPVLADWPILFGREKARRSQCRANLHNLGLGLGQWQADNKQDYPATLGYRSNADDISANAWGRIYSVGYVSAKDVYVCPSTEKLVKLHKVVTQGGNKPPDPLWTPNAEILYNLLRVDHFRRKNHGDYVYLLNSSDNYDNARIHKVAAAGRIVAGDGLERQWMRNADIANLDSGRKDALTAYVQPNHNDGANLCYDDKAVNYIKTTVNFKRWIPTQVGATLANAPKKGVEMEPVTKKGKGPARPCLGGKYDWVRQGVIQNIRIEEDEFRNGANEHDDAYACEVNIRRQAPVDNIDKWWMLSEFQFETGIYAAGPNWTTDGKGRITGTNNGEKRGVVPVKKHKTDASIQPFRHYRPGTGRPDTAGKPAIETGIDIGKHKAGDLWTYETKPAPPVPPALPE